MNSTSNQKPKSTNSQAEQRKFQESWLSAYEGLKYDKEKDLMFCETCLKYPMNNKLGTNIFIDGTKKKTKDVLEYHWKQHTGSMGRF